MRHRSYAFRRSKTKTNGRLLALQALKLKGRCDKARLGLGLGLGSKLGFGLGLDLGLVLGS